MNTKNVKTRDLAENPHEKAKVMASKLSRHPSFSASNQEIEARNHPSLQCGGFFQGEYCGRRRELPPEWMTKTMFTHHHDCRA
jgi:hypothetical protein